MEKNKNASKNGHNLVKYFFYNKTNLITILKNDYYNLKQERGFCKMKKKFMAVTLSAFLAVGAMGGIAYATEAIKGEASETKVEVVDTVKEDEVLEYIKKNMIESTAYQGMGIGIMNQMMGSFDFEDMNRMMDSVDVGYMSEMMEGIDFEDMNKAMETTGMGSMSGMMNGSMGHGMGNMMGR
ncbi:MAG: hypothetical protein APF76_14345 [Desulfitibacter sp. BRH_c19]|nr:MAG: hypothetical protein APF76_14345 [Desulfitibacter sp. BRH_c19]